MQNSVAELEKSCSASISNGILIYVLAPVIVVLIVAVLKFIFNNKLLYVKEIKKSTDPDTTYFNNLYDRYIKKRYRICAEEILSYIGKNAGADVCHYLYACKKWNKAVGFIKFMVSKSQKYIFIAYIVIDNKDAAAREAGAKILIKKVCRKFFKPSIADRFFIESEKGEAGHYSKFSKLVARYARMEKKSAYIFDFDYIQPNMPDDNYGVAKEEHMSLMMIPFFSVSHVTITKEQLLGIVKMIYYDIYCPSCNSITNCCELDYSKYLERIINGYQKELSQTIKLLTF